MDKEIFCVTDLWAAEAILTALDAGEPEMLSMLHRGIKLHNWMLDETTRQFPDEVLKAGYVYKNAKQTIHALNYNVQPPKMALESKLPLYVCEWQYRMYHGKFPGIKLRMARIKTEVVTESCTRTLLGRTRFWFAPFNPDTLNEAYAYGSQSLIGELNVIASTKIYYWGQERNPWMFPAMNTHDGLVTRCYEKDRQAVRDRIVKIYKIPVSKNGLTTYIPLEVQWGYNFNDLFDTEVIFYGNNQSQEQT